MIMFILHARIVLSGNFNTCVVYEQHRVPSTPLWNSSLINDSLRFPNHRHELSINNEIMSLGE
jgi:hypothetical protein